jgi:hypothetical protein
MWRVEFIVHDNSIRIPVYYINGLESTGQLLVIVSPRSYSPEFL